jgi:hypothetical protein
MVVLLGSAQLFRSDHYQLFSPKADITPDTEQLKATKSNDRHAHRRLSQLKGFRTKGPVSLWRVCTLWKSLFSPHFRRLSTEVALMLVKRTNLIDIDISVR